MQDDRVIPTYLHEAGNKLGSESNQKEQDE